MSWTDMFKKHKNMLDGNDMEWWYRIFQFDVLLGLGLQHVAVA